MRTGKNKFDFTFSFYFSPPNGVTLVTKQNVALHWRFDRIIDRVSCELDLFLTLGLAGMKEISWEYCNLSGKSNPDDKCE